MALLVKQNIPHTPLPSVNSNIENIAIKLNNNVIINSSYARPYLRMHENDLNVIFNQGQQNIIFGDLNARHAMWHNRRNNRNGHLLCDYATEHNIQIISPNTPTHYPMNGMTPSYIDLALNKNVLNFPEPLVLDELSSDHQPLLFEWKTSIEEEKTQKTWTYRNADWRLFRDTLNAKIEINNNINTVEELEQEVAKLTKNLQLARDKVAKKTNVKPAEDQLPEEVLNIISFKNNIRRRWQRLRRPLDRVRVQILQETIRTKINAHKNKAWAGVLENLSTRDNSLWRLARRLKNKFNKIPSLDPGQPQNSQQKANALAMHLAAICSGNPNTPRERNKITETVNKIICKKYPIPPPMLSRLYTSPNELKQIIRTLPNNKAPGEDEVAYILIKNMPRKAIVQYMYVINAIMLLQHFPTAWKSAIVIPLLKPGKNPTEPDSYRPIALLNSLSKVFEKILLARIKTLNLYNVPEEQFGFRGEHSTTLLAAKVVQDTLDKMNLKQSTVLLALDIKRAFDNVWFNGLLYKLATLHNFPLYMVTLLHTYMVGRTFKVKVEGTLSLPQKIHAGVPQGTVLSPVLFNLYTTDIPKYPSTKLAMFADDVLIYASSFYANVARAHINNHLRSLIPWYARWKLAINESKCECLVATKKFTNIRINIPLMINGTPILPANKLKYLGVILDSRIRFTQHTSHIMKKGFAAMQSLYSILSPKSPLSPQNKLIVYNQIIRPVLAYAAPVWCSISNAQMHRLQRMQNKILRCVTSSGRYVTIE